jgi:3-oxoacyl-[acyl-carrier-protein] synthase II
MITEVDIDSRRVVVTGAGMVSPLGLDAESSWGAILACRSGVSQIENFDTTGLSTTIAASVKGFDAARYMSSKEARRNPAFVNFALAAAQEALTQSGLRLEDEDLTRIGVEIGSALGGSGLVEEQRMALEQHGPRQINPSLIPSVIINAAACRVSIQYGLRGPVNSPAAACTTGTIAIGDAARRLAWGDADVILTGGTESVITALGIGGFSRLGACSTKNHIPEQACSPFDAGRDGTVVGEGAAVLVLETLSHARRRGANILAELLGYGFSCDAYHAAAPEPNGTGAALAISRALSDADVSPADLDWVCAHGTGTPLNDMAETRALKTALGKAAYRVPVSSLKGGLGHTLGAAGSMSAVIALKALRDNQIPPTLNYRTPDPDCDLDYVPNQPRRASLHTVLLNSFGIGGQNACLVFKKWKDTPDTEVDACNQS